MASFIKKGESIFIPFRDGHSISDSQLKPRMYKTEKAFVKSFPGYYLGTAGVELVEYAEVVHGWWEDEYGGAFVNPRYRCSVCKEKALYRHEQDCLGGWHEVQALTDYCPNCGAKMDGDGNA